jgi:hypothetical protein
MDRATLGNRLPNLITAVMPNMTSSGVPIPNMVVPLPETYRLLDLRRRLIKPTISRLTIKMQTQ